VGASVARSLRGADLEPPVEEGACPVCSGRLLELLEGGRARCPLCGLEGELVQEQGRWMLRVRQEELARARWALDSMLKHVLEVVMPTRDRYLARLEEIRKALEELLGWKGR